MTIIETTAFLVLLVFLVAFSAKVGMDAEPIDTMTLIALSIAIGYTGHRYKHS